MWQGAHRTISDMTRRTHEEHIPHVEERAMFFLMLGNPLPSAFVYRGNSVHSFLQGQFVVLRPFHGVTAGTADAHRHETQDRNCRKPPRRALVQSEASRQHRELDKDRWLR
jgi:hypothetical protein